MQLSIARWCYTVLFYLATPLILLRLLWRARLAPAYRQRIAERFGFFKAPLQCDGNWQRDGIWVHAVSVGETIAAAPLIHTLQARYPQVPITVTTMTPTGSERVIALFGNSVTHVYAPYDMPDAIARFLRRVQPRLAIIIETELWPNTVHACARRGIPLLLANARLSARSARGYGKLRALTTPMLRELTCVVAQNAEDGERFIELGLPRAQLVVSGSIKFDIELDTALRAHAQQMKSEWQCGDRLIWIGASTHAGEDELLLQAHKQLRAHGVDALLILVPRHPERFNAVAELIERAGFSCVRRSQSIAPSRATDVLLADSMGELLLLYGAADIAVVGGSFIARGGHNMLEPAAWGLPIIAGASVFNFREIAAELTRAGAMTNVQNSEELAAGLIELAGDAVLRNQRGAAARAVIDANRGALAKLLTEITRFFL